MRRLILAFLAAGAAVMPLHAQSPAAKPDSAPAAAGEGRAVALKLADELLKTFVLPENA
jgi:hypothetical protein